MMKRAALAMWLGKLCGYWDTADMQKQGMKWYKSRKRAVFKAVMSLTCSVNLNEFNRSVIESWRLRGYKNMKSGS